MKEYLHKHILACAVLCAVLGCVGWVFVHEHNQAISEQAARDTTIKLKELDNKRLDVANADLKKQVDNLTTTTTAALATIKKDQDAIQNSAQAIAALNKLLAERGLQPVSTDAAGNAVVTKDNLVAFAKQAEQCKADATELKTCKATTQIQASEIKNDQDKLDNKQVELDAAVQASKGGSTTQRVKHDAKVIILWEGFKAVLRAVFKKGGIKL